MLELRTLGGVFVQRADGTRIGGVVAQRRSLALLAVLAVAGEAGVRREAILALLWPDADPDKSRHALTQSLYQLRRGLGRDDAISTTGANIRLNSARIASDVTQFVLATDRRDGERALELYAGPFLDGFVLPGSVDFDQWVSAQRTRFQATAARALECLATTAESSGEFAVAVAHLRKLVSLDPLNAAVTMRLMRTMALAGDRAGAIRQGREHAALMRDELELEPDAGVARLIDELREAPDVVPRASTERADPTGTSRAVSVVDSRPTSPGAERRRAPTSPVRWVPLALAGAAVAAMGVTWTRVGRETAEPASLSAATQPVVVAPFRVASSDSSLGYLREGIVELLSARLSNDSAVAAIDAGQVLVAWRRARLTGAADTPHPTAVRIARELGASRVVVGGVVGNATRLVVSASLLGVADGRARAQAQVEGSADSITILVDRLATQLIAKAAGEGDRFSDRFTPSVAALRDYLEGQVAYGRGDYAAALPAYERALVHDSAFALAAMQLALAADHLNDAEQHDRALAIAWAHRDDLNDRDLAHLIAFAGPGYPAPSLETEQVAAWERAAERAGDRADVWYELGERLFRAGGVVGVTNAHRRARTILARALALEPTHVRARRLLIMLASRAGDTATLSRIATPEALRDSVGEMSAFLRWRVALAFGDSAELRQIRRSMRTLNDQSLRAIAMSSLNDAVGIGDGERAARISTARADQSGDWYDALMAQHSLALNMGRPALALTLTSQLQDRQPSDRLHLRLRILDAIYAEGDQAAAASAADSLAPIADAPLARDANARAAQLADACVLEQWRLRQGAIQTTPRAIARLRRAALPRRAIPLSANQWACASILDAWHAAATRRHDAAMRVAMLDSLMLSGPAMSDASSYAHILVGRLYVGLGNPRAALTAFRRRSYMTGWPRYLATVRREEAAVAVLLGDTTIARASYGRYLALRRRPEPSLFAAVNEVRKQAGALAALRADVERD